MYVVIVDIHIEPQRRSEFVASLVENAKLSLRDEPGCARFDVVEDEADPQHLILYEHYADRAAFENDHLRRPHFLRWRDTVREWHAVPPQSWKGTILFPTAAPEARGPETEPPEAV